MRFLILIHRYLGIAIGIVMAMWCISGIVMMYVRFPTLDSEQRLSSLESITWQGCCATESISTALGVDVVDDFSIEMVAGHPVLNVSMAVGRRHTFDLQSGAHIEAVTRAQALAVAARHAQVMGVTQHAPQYRALVERDQWTVQGQFDRDRPLHHIAFDDANSTELYVSNTGAVVQHTTVQQRFWNWLGSVPHWLYPTVLRQHADTWAQVMIWLSLAGVFLTVIGLYIGIAHWLAMKGKRWSPYKGAPLWHHLSGLFFGVLVLTWVGSGLVSMSPWGLFAGSGFKEARDRVRDMWIDGAQISTAVRAVVSSPAFESVTRIESAPFNGKLYLLAYKGVHAERMDAKTLQVLPLQLGEIERAAKQLVGKNPQIELLTQGDDYYYSGHESRALPVYRVTGDDANATRYYLDSNTGDMVFKAGTDERWYRWLFEGLHRWDFSATLRTRPWWDLLVMPLMLGVTLVCFTGVYMGYRRLIPRARKSATPSA